MTSGFTDLHHHLLWGLDDGPETPKAMHAMIRASYRDGVRNLAATPHVMPGLRSFDMGLYRERLSEAREYCVEKGYNMRLISGCEILYTEQTADFLLNRRIPTLADSEYVLVEFLTDIPMKEIEAALFRLQHNGFIPIVAHVERYRCFRARPAQAVDLRRRLDVFYQMNCGFVVRKLHWAGNRFFKYMMKNDAIDLLSTDSHNTTNRKTCMRDAWNVLEYEQGEGYADRLTHFGDVLLPSG